MSEAVFAIPGDKDRRTGGFIYEATVLRVLNEIGCPTEHLVLPDSFPDPTPADMAETLSLLRAIDRPIILDGLVFGAIDPAGLASVPAPVIAMIHHPLGLETGLPADRAAFLLRNEAKAIRHAAHILVPSPETARVLAADFGADPQRITVALPGFDRPNAQRQPVDPPLILSVGLLAERKGHDILLSALAQITDLPWQAEIVGKTHDPETAEALFYQATDLALTDRITFAGELSANDLATRFTQASLFALATRYEGYGMVLSEAMTFGLPVVTTRVGAVPDTVGNAALLVPPDDPDAFAGALRQLLENVDALQAYAALSQERANALPTWTDTAQIFADTIGALRK
ncbi:MAG: glycosyltransferase family 4 protein [Pseudomonadota bacterium]